MYSVKDIQSLIRRSPQSIYKLMKSNKELKEILKDHIIKEGHNVYYDEIVFEWFKKHYRIDEENKSMNEESVSKEENKTDNSNNPQNNPPPYDNDIKEDLIKELRQQIADMKDEITELKNNVSKKDNEINSLINLLTAEKQEKLLLMSPPAREEEREEKKSFFQKIRGLMKRKD